MASLYNVSSNPHVRSSLTTQRVMLDVILALLPATLFGLIRFGFHAVLVVALSIIAAVASEYIFCLITKRPSTIGDLSAVVTGLLLALCLSPTVPLYIPVLGSVFAIVFAKAIFGGLGQNFMNPALAGRGFLLISFGVAMTNYGMDGMSSATPLERIANGIPVPLMDIIIGNTNGIIGLSAIGVFIGGLYLLYRGHITWHIPATYIGSFLVMLILFGGHGIDPTWLMAQLCAGGVMLGAIFMATDPVTSPMTATGMSIFGVFLGILTALFRLYGASADSVSFAIIIANLLVPLIDSMPVPRPFGLGVLEDAAKPAGKKFPTAAVTLCVITLIAGLALGGVYTLTKDAIAEQEAAAEAASYAAVLPGAENFTPNAEMNEMLADLDGSYGDGQFGKVVINKVIDGTDASGNITGYAISVTSKEGFDGTLTVAVGIQADGTVNGISFTELHETAGMGMEAEKPEFKEQFNGVNTDAFNLVKGNVVNDNDIDAISGATITSRAVINAVNAALDLFKTQLQ